MSYPTFTINAFTHHLLSVITLYISTHATLQKEAFNKKKAARKKWISGKCDSSCDPYSHANILLQLILSSLYLFYIFFYNVTHFYVNQCSIYEIHSLQAYDSNELHWNSHHIMNVIIPSEMEVAPHPQNCWYHTEHKLFKNAKKKENIPKRGLSERQTSGKHWPSRLRRSGCKIVLADLVWSR